MMKSAITTTMILVSTGVYADKYSTSDMSYSDALFYIQESLTDHGLVLSNHNHVGDMLLRTSIAVEADTKIYEHADVLGFCSSELSYVSMKADLDAIQFCPYNIYLYQEVGSNEVIIGFRELGDTPELKEIEELLGSIIISAIE